jgi:thioesterase domain-containing protein
MANTSALFARVSRISEKVILPINDCALNTDVPKPAFFCVHSISGIAGTDFLDLAERLDLTVRFYGIQAPPKMTDPEFGSSVESIAEHYVDALTEFQPEGPIVLGGYCVGAVVALQMAASLRARGREVGPLLVIDGAPENTEGALHRRTPRYWLELARNLPGWMIHGDLTRYRSFHSLMSSLSRNVTAIGRALMGLRRGEKRGGGYAIDSLMDLSIYPPVHRLFINRLFGALFAYNPKKYPGDVVVYEAKVTPLLYLPQVARTWRKFAPQSEIVGIVGTHISMMHEPFVDRLAEDIRKRVLGFSSTKLR